jgi:uncharacterized protein (DUF1015 family)
MAEIKPLRAWRYNPTLAATIDDLTSPLFDVVSQKQRMALYENEFNSIYLSVPKPPNEATNAAKQLKNWKEKGILLQDKLPTIYVYYQYFNLQGSSGLCRKGFVCNIKVHDWDEKVILRHENTIPSSVNDRIELLEKTELNVSPTHGLYTDSEFRLEKFMDDAIQHPIIEVGDYQGVRDVMAVIQDATVIQQFIDVLKDKNIILADGHHRYEGSLIYMDRQKAANPNHTGNEGYNFHLMYLTNTEAGDLKILPTHRLIKGLTNFNKDQILKKLEEDFIIRPAETTSLNEIILGKQWAFGIVFKDEAFKIKLKPESFQTLKWNFPEVIKRLDLTVMHYFIIEKILGIPGKEQRTSENITFDRNFLDCITKVATDEAQLALITQDISIEEVKQACASGFTMPQKSTYFYPKVICGFLFGSINEKEFQNQSYSPF